jgi:hypothetical protein
MTYATKFDARKALSADGYRMVHTPPATPILWLRVDDGIQDRRCVCGDDSVGWRIVPYPRTDWLTE